MTAATATHTIVQISDTHLVADGLLHDRVDTEQRLARMLDKLQASSWRPELLILSGDLADHGEPQAYRRLRAILEPAAQRLGAAVVYLAGNHDDRDVLQRELLDVEPDGRPLDRITWVDGLRVITLDSTVPGLHHGELSDDQLTWLTAELTAPAPEGTILAVHHPPLLSTSEFSTMLSLREPQRLADAIRGTDVRIVLSGHLHTVISGTLGGVPVWSAPALAYYGDVAAPADSLRAIAGGGMTIVQTFASDTTATFAQLDDPADPAIYEIGAAALLELVAAPAGD
jgi:Icc protein